MWTESRTHSARSINCGKNTDQPETKIAKLFGILEELTNTTKYNQKTISLCRH
uniref:Uncharacterized protein n=1 Tax=Arion vulgaris TaxID=1028688 RepID=A0A0B7A8H9_9EUPU